MKKKVFLLHNIISPYRLPLFEKLSEEFDLDVKFCKIISRDRLWCTKLKGYSFKNEILENISIGRIMINYSLPFKLIFNRYDAYIMGGGDETIFSGFVVLLISKLFKKPFIVWSGDIGVYNKYYRDTIIGRIIKGFYHYYLKLLYRYADSFIAYGEDAKDFLVNRAIPEQKIFIGTQVISGELKRVKILKKDFGFQNKKIILFLSYFYKRKGGDVLIKAFKKMNRKDAILIMAGAGEEEDNLKFLTEGVENIYFPGYVSGKEKAKYLSIADIFVLPTSWDPWGLVINEAMMSGLPVITTENAGCSKELIDGNGFVVKADDEVGLRSAIEKLLDDDELREKVGARSKDIIKKYNLDYAVNAFKNAVEYGITKKEKWG